MNRRLFVLALGGSAIAHAAPTMAQAFPDRPIRLVVGFAPGGGSDAVARIIAKPLSDILGTPVIVENRPGAGGITATAFLANAAADGYTLQMATAGSYTVAPVVQKSLPYDVTRIKPVAQLTSYPNLLVASAASGIRDLDSLVARAKAAPGTLTYGSPGNATVPHLAFELLASTVGIKAVHVPYKGNGPAVTDLVGGQIDVMIGDPGPLRPHILSGRVHLLGVTSGERSSLFPDVPTLRDLGVKDYEVAVWLGITAPGLVPDETSHRIAAALEQTLQRKDVIDAIQSNGMEARFATGPSFGALLSGERSKWTSVIQRSGISE